MITIEQAAIVVGFVLLILVILSPNRLGPNKWEWRGNKWDDPDDLRSRR